MNDVLALIERLSRLAITPLLLMLVASASGLVLIRNWRITLPILIAQYIVVGLLLARSIQPSLALIKLITGALVSFSLSISAQRADDLRAERGESVAVERIRTVAWRSVPAQVLLRAVALLLVLTAAFGATNRFPLPGGARDLQFAAYILISCSLFVIASTPEALNIGIGLLMFISGIELGYTAIEPSVGISLSIGVISLVVGIAIAYLTIADSDPLDEGENQNQPKSEAMTTAILSEPGIQSEPVLPSSQSQLS
jgi:hypothetical protein